MIMNKLLFSFLASLTLFKLLRDFPAMKLQTIKKKLVEKITAFNLLISLLFSINNLFPDSYTIYKINGRIELILFSHPHGEPISPIQRERKAHQSTETRGKCE